MSLLLACPSPDIPPKITANIASISFFGVDVIAVCVVKVSTKKPKPPAPSTGCGAENSGLGDYSSLAPKPLNAPSKLLGYYLTQCLPIEPPNSRRRLHSSERDAVVAYDGAELATVHGDHDGRRELSDGYVISRL